MSKFIISEQEKSRILQMHQNATSRQYLNEDANSNIPQITFYLPQKKDASGKLVDNKVGLANYVITASKTPGGGFTTDEYSKVSNFDFDGTKVGVSSSIKDSTTGNINGKFGLDEKITYPFLVAYVNKGMQNGQTKIKTNMLLTAGNTELKETNFQVVYFPQQQPAQTK